MVDLIHLLYLFCITNKNTIWKWLHRTWHWRSRPFGLFWRHCLSCQVCGGFKRIADLRIRTWTSHRFKKRLNSSVNIRKIFDILSVFFEPKWSPNMTWTSYRSEKTEFLDILLVVFGPERNQWHTLFSEGTMLHHNSLPPLSLFCCF